jgi:uncharacterized cupredoxin-like copper-binding protein
MIWRLWVIAGVVIVAGAWALMVPLSPPPVSESATAIADYRADKLMPAPGGFATSDEVGHDIFELPAGDARHLEEAKAALGTSGGMPGMPGMGNSGMAPAAGEDDSGAMKMQADEAEDHGGGMKMETATESDEHGSEMKMPAEDDPGAGGMKMETAGEGADHGGGMKMPAEDDPGAGGMKMETADEGDDHGAGMAMEAREPAGGGHGGGGMAAGITIRDAAMMAAAGHGAPVDRTVELAMHEWGYAPGRLMVEPGETIRLVVTNAGKLPHEFMVMGPAAMQAVDYRLERADWNLTEHEAIFERPVVLPGDKFELILSVHRPGMWMVMCMFPYHMQLGMMGMVMTEGSGGAMPMDHSKM